MNVDDESHQIRERGIADAGLVILVVSSISASTVTGLQFGQIADAGNAVIAAAFEFY